jgi:hypothetical protein
LSQTGTGLVLAAAITSAWLLSLLALLSVLGGVGALGPIGIFVGPIAVAFLQAALTMLQAEIVSLSGQNGADLAGGAAVSGTDGVAQRGVERVKSS